MSDQPKSTTGEWTVGHVKELVGVQALRIDYTRIAKRIADAHNAALDDEREKHSKDLAQAIERTLNLEAEKFQLGEQRDEAIRLLEYKAAAQKPLVDALQMLRDYQNGCPLPSYEKGWNEAMAMTEAALAKVKEGK